MKLTKIEAGNFYCDGGAVFGVVPKKVWQKRYPCNDENFCLLATRCLLIDTGSRLILIDTGAGNKQPDYLKFYGFGELVDFEQALRTLGYTTAAVTDVVHTHLHFDHCGGATRFDAQGRLELVFPNAEHWLSEAQWENLLYPNVREGDSLFPENILPVEQAGKLRLIREDTRLCPEVELRLFGGHSPGQIVPYVALPGGKTLVYVGDVIPLLASIPIAWVSAYDSLPALSMEEKLRMLEEAVSEGQILFFEHDAYHECCTVKKQAEKYLADEVFLLEELL